MFGLTLLTPRSTRSLSWDEVPEELVRVELDDETFSFWADQVTRKCPIVLPGLQAIVTTADDERDYETILSDVHDASGLTALHQLERAAEDSYASAAERNRQLKSPTWLGLGRDMRTFGFNLRGIGASNAAERMWDWIAPQWHGEGVPLDESTDQPVRYQFMVGRGIGPHEPIERRLSEGTLPILEAALEDGHISYELTAFVALERQPLTETANTGTHFLRADGHSAGHMFTPDQQAQFDRLEAAPLADEETVLFVRVRATNTDPTPRYAYLKLPAPFAADQHFALPYTYRPAAGTSGFSDERVFCVASVDGAPFRQEEMSLLLQPGQTAIFDLRVPHRPITAARAEALRHRDYGAVLGEVRAYWHGVLDRAASVQLPEKRISQMVSAGLLHLDLVAYGEEPAGTLAPTIGVYSPIGSESAPIIQFFDSMGRPDLARRSLQYFFDKQHDDGFMQNFGGYMLETEAALWSLGEHFRYTRDLDWVAGVLPGIEAAVDYIVGNRRRQQESGAEPHGLIVGKTADPEDPYAAFMLNGYAYLGLARAAEMVRDVDPEKSKIWAGEAAALRDDIRAAFEHAVGQSPVVPLGNGEWVRTAPPWPGQDGPLALDRGDGRWFTHGASPLRDSLLGPLWLVFQEVLEPGERLSSDLLDYHAELFHHDNSAFSQPYYSPHPLLHLRRGEVKAFLSAYYTMVASLADPETYSFWEHYFHASPHKTHEEAWFLMQTRWMLYLECDDELRLLPGIPRAWLAAGEHLVLDQVRSYFGPLDLDLRVSADGDTITVDVSCDPERAPAVFCVRVPHPSGRRATGVSGGNYDAAEETVRVEPLNGRAAIQLRYC
ncbi:MAG: hypothetical protein ABWY56_16990 [Propionibacteriaceae bacterium]